MYMEIGLYVIVALVAFLILKSIFSKESCAKGWNLFAYDDFFSIAKYSEVLSG